MDLTHIIEGRHALPPRIIAHGEHGLGKSTFAAGAPKPIFIQTEDGLTAIKCSRFPLAQNLEEVESAIESLFGEHDFKTVVVDSLDWLEQLIWASVAEQGGYDSIEGYGFGKGYVIAAGVFKGLLDRLNKLRRERSMAVILTAHCHVVPFTDPNHGVYDRFTLKLHKKAAPLAMEWADVVAFCSQEMAVRQEDAGFDRTRGKAIMTGGRVMHLHRSPAFDAKERYGLPEKLPLSWAAFSDALKTALKEE